MSEDKKLLFGVCGVMYVEDMFGKLWSRMLSDDTVRIAASSMHITPHIPNISF